MIQKNGKLLQVFLRSIITVLLLLALYWMNDIKNDLRELRDFTTNHITEIKEDVGKIKGKLGIDD